MRPLGALLATALLSTLTACTGAAATGDATPTATTGFHGVEPNPAPARPEFVLKDTSGRRYDFDSETKGRPTFVYFGYTHCPDACPTAMADLASALRKASPALRAQARVVFVTTDPKRDTAPVIRRWLDQFSTTFVGLLGTQAQLDAAQRTAGIQPAYPDGVTPTVPGHPDQHVHQPGTAPHKHFGPLGYAVQHSAVIFAYDAADRLPVLYPGGVTPSDIAADLPVLAKP
ncbi:MAG: putative Sco1/SenC family protein [Frankiales bacterium]|nr:putative Sco1/SenC family protein [Frankiales bacterium]